MTDYDLQTGDELYYRKSDESHTIAFIDEHSYQLEGSDIAKDVVLLRRRIENGDIEHRPIRADGGPRVFEEETFEIELTEEQLEWLYQACKSRLATLEEQGRGDSDEADWIGRERSYLYLLQREFGTGTEDV